MCAMSKLASASVLFLAISTAPAVAAELTAKQKSAVKAAIGEGLADPYSAQYTFDIVVPMGSTMTKVCGTVNAKNKLGGYVGKTAYVAALVGEKLPSKVFLKERL